MVLRILFLVAFLVLPRFNEWAAVALLFVLIALQFTRYSRMGGGGAIGSIRRLLRGFALLWLAVSVVSVVLIGLDSFHRRENQIGLLAIFAILVVLWLAEDALGRATRNR